MRLHKIHLKTFLDDPMYTHQLYLKAFLNDRGYRMSDQMISVGAIILWDDKNDQDGLRPSEITVTLFKNGTRYKTKTVTAADGWIAMFYNVSVYEDGRIIDLSIGLETDGIPPYTLNDMLFTDDRPTITVANHNDWDVTIGNTRVTVTKKRWDDSVRPSSFVINLYGNDRFWDSKHIDAADGWKATFYDLPFSDEDGIIDWTVDGYMIYETPIPR